MDGLFQPTIILLIATAALWAAYDTWVIIAKGYEATISHSLLTLAQRFPIIPFVLGLLCGHLFWSNH